MSGAAAGAHENRASAHGSRGFYVAHAIADERLIYEGHPQLVFERT